MKCITTGDSAGLGLGPAAGAATAPGPARVPVPPAGRRRCVGRPLPRPGVTAAASLSPRRTWSARAWSRPSHESPRNCHGKLCRPLWAEFKCAGPLPRASRLGFPGPLSRLVPAAAACTTRSRLARQDYISARDHDRDSDSKSPRLYQPAGSCRQPPTSARPGAGTSQAAGRLPPVQLGPERPTQPHHDLEPWYPMISHTISHYRSQSMISYMISRHYDVIVI